MCDDTALAGVADTLYGTLAAGHACGDWRPAWSDAWWSEHSRRLSAAREYAADRVPGYG